MSKFFTLLYLLVTICTSTLAQNNINGKVVNEENKAITYATISDLQGSGCVCDSSGNFVLEINSKNIHDKFIVQALGYQGDTISSQILVHNPVIHLKRQTFGLNEIQITANNQIESMNAVSCFKIKCDEMMKQNPENITGILESKAGFTNKSGYQAPITLRGLTGKRLLVLRNGMRRFSSYPAGYMSHTINIYDLEKIEIEKGAASVTYGGGAIAGIINMMDKSPFNTKGFNMKFTTGYGSINKEKNLLAYASWTNGKLAFKAGGRCRNADNFSYPDGTLAKNSFYKDQDATVNLGYKVSDRHQVLVYADCHNGGPWGKPVGFNGTKYMRVSTQKEISNNLSLQYTFSNKNNHLQSGLNIYYSNESRELIKKYYTAAGYTLSYVETTHFSDYYYGAKAFCKVNFTPEYSCNVGAEGYQFHISTPSDAVDYIDELEFSNRVSHNARSAITGVYLENKYQINEKNTLIGGIRYNLAEVYEGDVYSSSQDEEQVSHKEALSAQVAFISEPVKNTTIKINASRSFRMPEPTELYTDNYTSNGIIYGNSALKPEYCYSLDFCLNYHKNSFYFEFSPFIWLLDNLISKEEIKGLPGTNYTYTNISKSRIYGGETQIGLNIKSCLKPNDVLKINVATAYLNGTDVTESSDIWSAGTPLDYVPPFNLKSYVSYELTFNHNVHCYAMLRSVYYSEPTRLGESTYTTPAYVVFNLDAGISVPTLHSKPSLNFTIQNLTNKTYYTYQSYLPAEGRDYRIFITFHI